MIDITVSKGEKSRWGSKILPYYKIGKNQLKFSLFYKVDFWFSIVGMFLKVLIAVVLWKSLYSGGVREDGVKYTLESMLLYTTLGVGLSATLKTDVVKKMNELVNKGGIITKLIQPLSLQMRFLAQSLGDIVNNLLLKFSLVFILSLAVFKLDISIVKGKNLLGFLLLMALGFLIIFLIDYGCAMLSFWTTQLWGINQGKKQIVGFLSGAFIPLNLFPEKVEMILQYTPFPYIFYLPLNVLLGQVERGFYWRIVLIQLVWVIVLFAITRILWKKGSKTIFVQGG